MSVRFALMFFLLLAPLAARAQSIIEQLDDRMAAIVEALKLGKLDVAERDLERVLEQVPGYSKALFLKANLEIERGNMAEAVRLLESLLAVRPDDHFVLNNLAWILATTPEASQRDLPRALGFAQQAALLAPEDYHVWHTLAEIRYRMGDFMRAAKAVNHMLTLAFEQDIPAEEIKQYREQRDKVFRAAGIMMLKE